MNIFLLITSSLKILRLCTVRNLTNIDHSQNLGLRRCDLAVTIHVTPEDTEEDILDAMLNVGRAAARAAAALVP